MSLELNLGQTVDALRSREFRAAYIWVDDLFGEDGDFVLVDRGALARLIEHRAKQGYDVYYSATISAQKIWLRPAD